MTRQFCSVRGCVDRPHCITVVLPGACLAHDVAAAAEELARTNERTVAGQCRAALLREVLDEFNRHMLARAERAAGEVLQ